MNKLKFEDFLPQIDSQLMKRSGMWKLTAVPSIDYEDISQIIRLHIYKKWHLYDDTKPIGPWINTIITNQIKNLIRNNYGNFARPCLHCAAAEGEDLCSIYGQQCAACPLYKTWLKGKKNAYDIKLPVSIEGHSTEVNNITSNSSDISGAIKSLHVKMKIILKPKYYNIYKLLYIDGKSEEQVAKILKLKTSEKDRSPGYKWIKKVKKIIVENAKEILETGEIII